MEDKVVRLYRGAEELLPGPDRNALLEEIERFSTRLAALKSTIAAVPNDSKISASNVIKLGLKAKGK